jgi:hypothetical protein
MKEERGKYGSKSDIGIGMVEGKGKERGGVKRGI